MRRRINIILFLSFFILISGCTHVILEGLRAKADLSLTFGEVLQNPDAYKGKFVIWGGEIIQALPQEDGTNLIEVLEWPLGWRGEPRRTVSFRGKFLILIKENLDLSFYKRGTKITVAGEIQGVVQGEKASSFTDVAYRYSLLLSKEIHLWKDFFQYSAPYDPRRYDPSYDPHRGAGILRY